MPLPFDPQGVASEQATHLHVHRQPTIRWLRLVVACLALAPATVSAQSPESPASTIGVWDLPVGGLGLDDTSDIDDDPLGDISFTADPFACDYPLFDPNLLEANRILDEGLESKHTTLFDRVVSDHQHFYDWRSFRLLGSGFLIAAATANTQLDQELHDHFQSSVQGATSDDWSEFLHADKELGNGRYTLPVFATAWAAGAIFDESPMLVTTGRWGERSLRSFLVGAPP